MAHVHSCHGRLMNATLDRLFVAVLRPPVTIVGFDLFYKEKLAFAAGGTRFESRGKVWLTCTRGVLNGNF